MAFRTALLFALILGLVMLAGSSAPPASADNCGAIQVPWNTPLGDDDCDGFSTSVEQRIGTRPYLWCADGATSGQPSPNWPADLWRTTLATVNKITITDLSSFIAPVRHFSTSPGDAGFDVRWDLIAGGVGTGKHINLLDISTLDTGGRSVGTTRCDGIAAAAPPYSVSRYMSTVDSAVPGALYDEGCALGDSGPDEAVVILDFGQPWWDGSRHGVNLFDANATFRPLTPAYSGEPSVREAAKAFLFGYWYCTVDTPSKNVTLAVGTNNCRANQCTGSGGDVTYGHGVAFANMVNEVNTWIDGYPSYRSRERAWGANDIQLDWSSPAEARDWANGYNAVYLDGLSSGTQWWPYVNYGSAEGCPPVGSCNNGWTQTDVRYVSWELAAALPLPEIYNVVGTNAAQWRNVSRDIGFMNFKGTLTDAEACADRPGPTCVGANNSPAAGWQQLWMLLHANTATAYGPEQSTDITWSN